MGSMNDEKLWSAAVPPTQRDPEDPDRRLAPGSGAFSAHGLFRIVYIFDLMNGESCQATGLACPGREPGLDSPG
jgi:hypothetical protein